MQQFTQYGLDVIHDLTVRYGVSADTVTTLLFAVQNGGGTMAQFYCPELGGGGQWMQGGMTMVGDMFNYGLKATVDNLCSELSSILANQQGNLFVPIKKQPHHSLSIPHHVQGSNWWSDEYQLGNPSSTGSQNNIRYAVFPQTARLAVEINGQVTVYNTLDHQIGGVSQQQGYDASLTFSSQYGTVQISQLPIVSLNNEPQIECVEEAHTPHSTNEHRPLDAAPMGSNAAVEDDIFNKIERLAALKEKGILTDDEFSQKKAELLQRL